MATYQSIHSGQFIDEQISAVSQKLPINGTAASATKLATARTISLTGDVTGSATFDGSANASITTTVADNSHNHSNYLPLTGGDLSGNLYISTTNDNKIIGIQNTSSGINFGLHLGSGGINHGIYDFQNSQWIIYSDGANSAKTQMKLYGAVWNDYAEYRICNEKFIPGQVVYEKGDDTVKVSTERLQRGCSFVSDTFGFAIGETEEAKCPIAVAGRVLAYPYESREKFAEHIGWSVCSGPNGTVSIMSEWEEEKYPSRIIGTISSVPDYDEWGTGKVKVDGRVWIKVK